MKWVLALLSLALVWGCTFPDYNTNGGGGGNGAGGGESGTGNGGTASGATSGTSGVGGAPDAPSCENNKRDGDETGLDCGMVACSKPCPPGQGCDTDADCDGGKCKDKICAAQSCDDGLTNNGESDQDCGGDQGCPRCMPDQLCNATSDCDGGACTNGRCQKPSCKDKLQNQDETDVDCGGATCDPCEAGGMCTKLEDCDNILCTKGKCQPASCNDKLANQDETDTDCGGSCEPCADTLKCKVAGDCTSGVCSKSLVCAAPTCNDKVKNGTETGVDCSGSCSTKCPLFQGCSNSSDCAALSCVSDKCLPSAATGKQLTPLNWVASASNTYNEATNTTSNPPKAIDGVKNTFWTSGTAQTPNMWFALDLGAEQVIFSIEIDCFQQAMDFPSAINLWLSNDPTFPEPPVKTSYAGGAQIVVTFTEAQAARYIKISPAQGGDHWWSIDELSIKQ